MGKKIVYHGSQDKIEFPEIRIARYNKDFYFGFYCTIFLEQAKRWATRFSGKGMINEYEYNFDVVEGPMADDTIYNYVQNFIDGKITREAFWELVKFKYPTHQISFHSARALQSLKFVKSYEVTDEK